MRGKAVQKLRSTAGETILETLVALLISALALTMLAGAIAATERIVSHSSARLDEYYSGNDALMTIYGSGSTSTSTSMSYIRTNSASITFKTSGTDSTVSIMGDNPIPVAIFVNDAFSRTPVMMYGSVSNGG